MLESFNTFKLATEFYQRCKKQRVPSFLQSQFLRASSSIALNLAEGSGKPDPKEQRRYYGIALGSLRECQAIIKLESLNDPILLEQSDHLGALLHRLSRIRTTHRNRRTEDEKRKNLDSDVDVDVDGN